MQLWRSDITGVDRTQSGQTEDRPGPGQRAGTRVGTCTDTKLARSWRVSPATPKLTRTGPAELWALRDNSRNSEPGEKLKLNVLGDGWMCWAVAAELAVSRRLDNPLPKGINPKSLLDVWASKRDVDGMFQQLQKSVFLLFRQPSSNLGSTVIYIRPWCIFTVCESLNG